MAVYKIIKDIMDDQELKVADIARQCDLPDSTVRGIIRREQDTVALDVAFKLSDGLGISLELLNGMPERNAPHIEKAPSKKDEADEIANIYRKLDDHGKGAVKAILNFEHASAIAEKRQSGVPGRTDLKVKKRSDGFIEVKVYDQPAAAGLGNYLDDPDFHIEQYPANVIPDGTDFCIRISGDSMSPDIPDGCSAFIQSRSTIEAGKVGIFLLNGEAFCKKLTVDKMNNQIRLVSLNKKYEDRIVEECDDFSTIGLVLGHWKA